MSINRRTCLKSLAAGLGLAPLASKAEAAGVRHSFTGNPDRVGVLVDLSLCIGCRKCEWACNQASQPDKKPSAFFEDDSVFESKRRTHADTHTVVNRFENARQGGQPVYVKRQCMHCDEPACASACLLQAFYKTEEGPVIYNPSLCMGCRYCMAACPFEAPAYQYDNAFTPQVTKCTLCYDRVRAGGLPACVEVCPVEALTFGKREELLKIAHQKIWDHPDRYVDHVYGENEVGGTDWLYVSSVPFEELGFRTDLGTTPVPERSRGFLSMVSIVLVTWPALCMAFFKFSKRRGEIAATETGEEETS